MYCGVVLIDKSLHKNQFLSFIVDGQTICNEALHDYVEVKIRHVMAQLLKSDQLNEKNHLFFTPSIEQVRKVSQRRKNLHQNISLNLMVHFRSFERHKKSCRRSKRHLKSQAEKVAFSVHFLLNSLSKDLGVFRQMRSRPDFELERIQQDVEEMLSKSEIIKQNIKGKPFKQIESSKTSKNLNKASLLPSKSPLIENFKQINILAQKQKQCITK